MKKTIFYIVTLFIMCGRLTAQSIPDGGFEYWNTATWTNPQYYNTSNDQNNGQNASYGIPVNVTQTAGKYGIYGLQLASIKYHGDTAGAYIINANTGGNKLAGGIPYNQKPTGIRFWYKYTTTGIDTAVVLVMFKLKGNVIDSFLVAIPSSQSASVYTLHSYYPLHPLSITPDTIIFGVTSSKGILNQKNNSKGIIPGSIFVIDSVMFTGVGSNQPAELNGDFENWIADTLNYPAGWYVSYPGTTITSDHYAGTHALQIETTNSPGRGVQQGEASTGYWPNNCNNNCHELGGFAYTLQKDTLEFWYKYAPMPNDTANVSLTFLKDGQTINCCSSISIFNTVSVWTYTTVPFDWGTAPDSVIVDLVSSQHNHDTSDAQYMPYVGSILEIDNITFASQKGSLGINTVKVVNNIKVYPNPSTGQYTITNLKPGMNIEVYDYSGRRISSVMVSDVTMQLNIATQPNGIYLLRILSSDGDLVGQERIVKI